MTHPFSEMNLLTGATERLRQTITGLPDQQWPMPSLLPGWTRAHVIAHLTLNAEGLTGVLHGATAAEPTPMYSSRDGRDRDINALQLNEPEHVRARFLDSAANFARVAAHPPHGGWMGTFERVPHGPTFNLGAVIEMRLREVEIHHADLDTAYGAAQWPLEFSDLVIKAMAARARAQQPLQIQATDTGLSYGMGGPRISGSAADLAWWLAGRGKGERLDSSDGTLPRIEAL
jgi:maleylpyruvate isomerase